MSRREKLDGLCPQRPHFHGEMDPSQHYNQALQRAWQKHWEAHGTSVGGLGRCLQS